MPLSIVIPTLKWGKKWGKMARVQNKLSDVVARSKLKPGRHSDGGGLYLNVTQNGSKSWLFMWTRDGKRREMGMGAYPEVSLAKARTRAADHRTAVEEGRDPIAEKAKEAEPIFSECVEKFLASMEGQWRNDKHKAQWRMTLTDYCTPIGKKKVSAIGTEDILKVLKPIWSTKSETASRLRGRMERVLDFAKAKGWRSGENPALWRGHLKSILPVRQKLTRGHHAAMPYEELPTFMGKIRELDAMAARALEFLILNASRSGEVLGATWDEMDLQLKVWTIPKERMKAGREHRVPLSNAAASIIERLNAARRKDNPHVFPGQTRGKPLSGMSMTMLMRRMEIPDATVHGFRSAFRDWAGDRTTFPREVAEAALAHTVGDETERAYRRSDALAKRRKLMEAWENYLAAGKTAKVIKLHG
jgi:integrase